jgi:type IV pilus assembly protein PilE
MEEYYLLNSTYGDATLENVWTNNSHYKNYYDLDIKPKNDTYVLRAIPRGKQAEADTLCRTLTLDQNGNRNISGSGSINDCWH